MPAYATAVRRGCGTRQKGGVYVEVGVAGPGEEGIPLEAFLTDPPLPVDLTAMGLTPVAVKMVERDGIWHVFDFVGEQHYPNITDFLEEVRRFGLSRRLPKTLDFGKLTSESKIILVHRKAWIEESGPYYDEWRIIQGMMWETCPKVIAKHEPQFRSVDQMCAGVWWQDIDPDAGDLILDENVNPRDITVKLPSLEYYAALRPEGHVPGYSPAIFASFPMHRLAVVNDPEGNTHEDAFEAASKAAIPTDLVEE